VIVNSEIILQLSPNDIITQNKHTRQACTELINLPPVRVVR